MNTFIKIATITMSTFYLSLPSTVIATVNKLAIDTTIQTFVKDKPIKAMIYGLWIDGQPVTIKALGESMTAVPASSNMHVRIGGITETMLTTILMKMVEDKKIRLDDKVASWFPTLPNANQVTLKMLANGTSGYADYVFNKEFNQINTDQPFKQWDDKTLLHYATSQDQNFAPGTSQRYSHTDYIILANILSMVNKTSLSETYRDYVLNKMKMKNTQYTRTAAMPSPVLHAFSQERAIYEDATFWDPSWTSFAAMTSTIQDLGIWANAWMRGDLLSVNSTRQLRSPDTVGLGNNKSNLYFAMGFAYANHWIFQNPAFSGSAGIFAVLPERHIVFIAFNTKKPTHDMDNTNYSQALWQQLASELAPDYPLPPF